MDSVHQTDGFSLLEGSYLVLVDWVYQMRALLVLVDRVYQMRTLLVLVDRVY